MKTAKKRAAEKDRDTSTVHQIRLHASEMEERDRVILLVCEACPTLKPADVIRAAVRSGLRLFSEDPQCAIKVAPL